MANDISKIKLPGSTTEYTLKDGSAITNITRSGTTFTATKRDGTTFTFTQQDNNTTYTLSVGTGDDANKIVLTPSSGTANKITVPYATSAGSATDSTKLPLAGGTMTGALTMAGVDIALKTTGSSSDDSADITWYYGNGQEKARLWTANEYTAKSGLNYRVYKKDGTSLYTGTIPLADGTGASGTWGISVSGNAATATKANSLATEVGQSAGARPVWYSYLGDNTRAVYHTSFTYNPSGGILTATKFVGDISEGTGLTKSQVTTALGYTPPTSDTNNAVTQTATSTNANYEVLFSATADNTTRTEGARKYSNLTFNPSTGTLTTNFFVGGNNGGGWHLGRNNATVKKTTAANTSTFYPIWSVKTYTGDWSAGTLGNGGEDLYFVNTLDTNYSGNVNKGRKYRFYGSSNADDNTTYDIVHKTSFTSGQIVIADGTSGLVKTSGYTIAKSVPSDAKFTDTTYTIDCTSSGIITLTASTGSYSWFQIPYAEKATYFSGGSRGSETKPIYLNDDGAPTACTYSLNKTVPSNAVFTDTNNAVTQTATTTSANYELLFSATADNTTRTEGARKTDSLKYNPSTKELTLNGTVVLNGYSRSTSTDPCPSIVLKANNIDTDTAVTARTYSNSEINVHDKDGDRLGFVNWFKDADGSIGFAMSAQNKSTGGTNYYNTLEMRVDKTGNRAYSISDAKAFRTAINTTTCSFTKSISSLAGATIVRRGNVVTLEFGHQITSAGSYTNIGTVSPAPIETLHFVVNCGSSWRLARINTAGVVSFNNATSVAANAYLIGSCTYITAD